jgi:hypothetical protein
MTEIMQEAERRRPELRVLMDSLEPALKPNSMAEASAQGEAPGAAELADRLVGLATADAATLIREDAQKIRTAAHLLGEEGDGFQELLPPLERGRFLFRSSSHADAQALLREVLDGSGTLADRLVAAQMLGRSLTAEAWAIGPSSSRGRDLLQEAWNTLTQAEGLMNAASPEELANIDATLGAGVYVDMMRTAMMGLGAEVPEGGSSWADREVAALQGFDRIATNRVLYDGLASSWEVLDRALAPLRTESAQARMRSDEPMPPSGFPEVSLEEVESFQENPAAGWTGFTEESEVEPTYWDEAWDEAVVRAGENGSGDPDPNLDRNVDGVKDPASTPEGTDHDGDGVYDGHLLDEVTTLCIEGECTGNPELCAEVCDEKVEEARAAGEENFPDAEDNPVLQSLRDEFGPQVDAEVDGDEEEDELAAAATASTATTDPAAAGSILERISASLDRTESCFDACDAALFPPPNCKGSCLFTPTEESSSSSSSSDDPHAGHRHRRRRRRR